MLFVQYFILAFLVVYLSLFLSRYVDELDKKTDMSGAFIGGILLAAVTSLPEFMTSISSIFLLKEPMLVQGNVLGSNIFNLIIIAIAIIFFPKKFRFAKISKSHIWTGICVILMCMLVYFGFNWNFIINLSSFNINITSILILILYFVNLKSVNSNEENEEESTSKLTVKQIIIRFIICAVLLLTFSVMLTNVTSKLNNQLNLGATVGGAIFLGVATSLPELTSSLTLSKLGNFNAAFGNVLGSNIFNFAILSISDILYKSGSIYMLNKEATNLIFWGSIASILAIFLLITQKRSLSPKVISVLILICYISSIVNSI